MEIVIISGRSGSGKTTALNVLEDIGYYSVDNLPVTLLPSLISKLEPPANNAPLKAAIGIDARNHPSQLSHFPDVLKELQQKADSVQVVYLDADEPTLLKRFSETRRKHPISNDKVSLKEAIHREKELLDPIATAASLHIETSKLNLYGLRDLIKERVADCPGTGMAILFQSFGFKHGIPTDTDYVFDVRNLPNPHWVAELRQHTGLDDNVIQFLKGHDSVNDMIHDIEDYLTKWLPSFEENNRSYTTIAIGCTGGQHRSVYVTERLTEHFRQLYTNVQSRHREL
ncbi:MAG: RNase adapter RapZ [Gammaproteobacteria bacterium]|nr:MAG: RNase adapter RapZ [Gammaproteobacteria bacterium]